MISTLTVFNHEPVAPYSAQFPLPAGSHTAAPGEGPSAPGIRPWNLRALAPAVARRPIASHGIYDPERQIRLTPDGRPASLDSDATAHSITTNDGDEGPSEDWKYDYCPDDPTGV